MSDLDFSATLGELAKALAQAQGNMENAFKGAVNPHLKSKYADLASVRAAVIPVLSKHRLAVVQLNEPHGDTGVCIVTMLMHESGEWIRSKLYIPVVKKDPQGFGAAITYGRRYALAAMAGIAQDDDDGNSNASSPPPRRDAVVPSSELAELLRKLESATDAASLGAAALAVAHAKRLGEADRQIARAAYSAAQARIDAGIEAADQ